MSAVASRPKRRRNVLSCVDCHRRKEKCDRRLPCSSCIMRPGAACRYEAPKLRPESRPPRPPRDGGFGEILGADGENPERFTIALAAEVKNFVPAGMYPLGSPRFMSIWESKWTPATAACPLILQSTTIWANASLEAFKGVPGSRETMWHRGKVLGFTANRINHLGHFLTMSDNLAQAVVLLAQVELTCDDAEAAYGKIRSLAELLDQGSGLERLGLDRLLRDFVVVADAVIAFMLSIPPSFHIASPPTRSSFESRLLSSSPLSPLEFSSSSYLLRLDASTTAILTAMKALCTTSTSRTPIPSLYPDDATCAALQSQPAGVDGVIAATSALWTRSILQRLPFAHALNTLDRLALLDGLYALDDAEAAFRYMPGVLVWVLLTACAAVGPDGHERRFLLPALQRWCIAVCFCTSAGAVLEMLACFRAVEGVLEGGEGAGAAVGVAGEGRAGGVVGVVP